MNKYFPKKEELKPITNTKSTFYECGFNTDFDTLEFKQKLQVLADIVRQSMKGVQHPDPQSDQETLYGNCHTSAIALMNYLKELNVGKNIKYVMCRKRSYDPADITSKHAAVLVDDEKGETYFVDPTAFVGFKYGVVQKLSNTDIAYEEYEELNNEKCDLMFYMRDFLYKASNNLLKREEIKFYRDIMECALKYPILDGYNSQCFYYMGKQMDNKFDADICYLTAQKINPYSHFFPADPQKVGLKTNLILEQIKKWKEELQELQLNNSTDYKRQLELATYIFQEMKLMDNSMDTKIPFEGKQRSVSHMTPRMMMEKGFNVAMIKSSAYHLGVSATIREALIKDAGQPIFEYKANVSEPRNITGIVPIIYMHPMGKENIRAYQGTSNIMLLKRPALELYKLKKQLRAELGKNINNQEVMWNDGEKILWQPFVTNLVHTTDNPSETVLHLLSGIPEQQLMTRFMYPNPKLEELSKEFEERGSR